MYYEEKIINGVLSYRSHPKDDWTPMRASDLTLIIQKWKNAAELWDCSSPEQLIEKIHSLPAIY